MDEHFAKLFSSTGRPGMISNDAIIVYLIMRADIVLNETETAKVLKKSGKLGSGLSVQSIAQRATLVGLTVNRALDELLRTGWIKSVKEGDLDIRYELGYIDGYRSVWYVDSIPVEHTPRPLSTIDKIRKLMAESNSRVSSKASIPKGLSPETKRKMVRDAGILVREKGSVKTLLQTFKSQVWEHFKEVVRYSTDGSGRYDSKYNVFAGRIIDWCGGSSEPAQEYVTWVVENWLVIRALCGLTDAAFPTLNILSSKKFFDRFQEWRRDGIPVPRVSGKKDDGIAKRADEGAIDSAKSVGW